MNGMMMTPVLAFCGYVAMLVVLLIPISVAAAIGIVGRIAGSRSVGCWTAAVFGVLLNVGLAAGLYYYNTHLAGGPPEPALHFRQFVASCVVLSLIGGGGSWLMCRTMR